MGKEVKIDGKNRIVVSILKEVGVIGEDEDTLEVVPNDSTGLLHKPVETVEDCEMVLKSLKALKAHYESKKVRLENDTRRVQEVSEDGSDR